MNWSAVARAVNVLNKTRNGAHKLGHVVVRDVLDACDVPHADMFKHKPGPTYRPKDAAVEKKDGTTMRCVMRPSTADAKRDLCEMIERGEVFTGVRFHSDPRVKQCKDGGSCVVRGGASGIIIPIREQFERLLERMSSDGLLRIMPDFSMMEMQHVDRWLERVGEPARGKDETVSAVRDRAVRTARGGGCPSPPLSPGHLTMEVVGGPGRGGGGGE